MSMTEVLLPDCSLSMQQCVRCSAGHSNPEMVTPNLKQVADTMVKPHAKPCQAGWREMHLAAANACCWQATAATYIVSGDSSH